MKLCRNPSNLGGIFRFGAALFSQFPILLQYKFKPDSTAPPSKRLLDFLAAGVVKREATTLRHLPDLVVILEQNLAGQGSLQILLKEPTKPALPEHEMHVDAFSARASASVA
jgi:hypothetical protein